MKTLVILSIAVAARAQSLSPSFDAASIKENRAALDGSGGGGVKPGGTVSMRNVNVRLLIDVAYGLQDYQLAAGPAWTANTMYDIEARPASAVDSKTARLMLQSLLAERFGLKVHHEDAAVSGFQLVIDKGGSKLKVSDEHGITFRVGVDRMQGAGELAMLASALRGSLRAPVEDRTGLDGKYDLDLKWTSDPAAEPQVSIFTAIRQLGLVLEPGKVTIDRLVIDHVERPKEN